MNKLKYFINESFDSILSNGVMSVFSIGTIAVSMFIFSFFLSFFLNANHIVESLESQIEISVYLNDDLSSKDISNTKAIIEQDNRIKSVQYISKDDAFESLKKRLSEEKKDNDDNSDIQNTKIENPLSNSFQVTVKDTSQIQEVVDEIQAMDGIDEATYGKEFIEKIFSINKLVHIVSISFIIILFFATIFIISNMIKVSVHARKTEIEIMKYMGANDSLIIIPFIIEGMVLGAFGGFIATIIFRVIYTIFTNKFHEIVSFVSILPVFPFITYISLFVFILAIIIGGIGSLISVKRYINV